MKTQFLVLLLFFCATQIINSQEEGSIVLLGLPVRNSLMFNRYAINPTFSFVREQNKYISFNNKREWIQFDDAPNTYLASYSGRFAENIGAGIGVFQQNIGVFSTYGGILNFAYNARLTRENNLTFGINVGAFQSGINTGNVITNFDDPSLQNVPDNTLLNINPGINLGLKFFDFGVSLNNLIAYNFEDSSIIKDNPEQGIQAHIMYTGYKNSRGFFDESKFSGFIRSEFKKEETVVSALGMITIPKGIWAQVGYNTVYGVSGGIGLNITSQIAIEYNFEKSIGDLIEFGTSHDITLAYRFKDNKNFDYSSGDEVSGLISSNSRSKRKVSNVSKSQAEANRKKAAERKALVEAKLLAEKKEKEEAEEQSRFLAEQRAKEEAEVHAKLLAEQKAKEEAEANARLLAEQKAKEEAETQARLLAEQKAKEEAETQAKLLAEQKAVAKAKAQAELLLEEQVKLEAEAQARLLAEQNKKEDVIANPIDEVGKEMLELTKQAEVSKAIQDELLDDIDEIVEIKNQDLKELKEENDLSEQGVTIEPKPFKSITEENNRLRKMIADLDIAIESRNKEIEKIRSLYNEKYEGQLVSDTVYLDEVYMFYNKTINRLTAEQIEAAQTKIKLQLELEEIQVATEFERNRRIKRALFNNEEERYAIDRATLESIKRNSTAGQVYKVEDFDFGEEQGGNIQILKNIDRIDSGYYVILAIHNNTNKRNDFVRKVIESGNTNVDFFYDVKTSKYYIYSNKFNNINAATQALKSNTDKPYNSKMSLVKIEN